ncbi:hypothetical protein [Psychroserpens ponticola]|uniref:Uncharacterized protein n=1 Tax=Psychroserpens ponticola TaxID=2932268 RepID=A0ABY7S3H6_9FLAO|nr:hypothetical protein [Psychroserpens ponticola]WCO03560.1 hypothetical protein MUN68_008635 [Psychroserpens ponticola]
MTSEIEKSNRKILYFLKKKFPMEVAKGIRFDLSKYSIIPKGKFLKNIYTWKLTEFDFDAYLLSIRNSYKTEIMGTAGESMVEIDTESKHNGLILKTESNLPELIIRPAYLNEKIANLFLKFDKKLNDRKEFNKKYILESSLSQTELEEIITRNITDELVKVNEFSLEFKDNSIFLKFEKEFNEQDSVNLINLGKIIETELKNVVQQRV